VCGLGDSAGASCLVQHTIMQKHRVQHLPCMLQTGSMGVTAEVQALTSVVMKNAWGKELPRVWVAALQWLEMLQQALWMHDDLCGEECNVNLAEDKVSYLRQRKFKKDINRSILTISDPLCLSECGRSGRNSSRLWASSGEEQQTLSE
jgi:hypothetical protein